PAPAPAPALVPHPTRQPELVSKVFSTGYSAVNLPYISNESLHSTLSTVLDGSQGVLDSDGQMHFTSTRLGAWAKGFGGFGRSSGSNVSDYGGVTGYGAAITRHFTLGIALSGSGTDTGSVYQQAHGHAFGGYTYGIYTAGHLRISGDMGAGTLALDTNRRLLPTNLTASASANGWFLGTGVQFQYLVPIDNAFVIPYAKFTYLHTALGALDEQGAGLLNLQTAAMRTNIGNFTGGLRTGIDLRAGGLTWIPWVELGGAANAGTLHLNVLQQVGLAGQNQNLARTLVAPAGAFATGAGLTLQGKGPWVAKLAYEGQFAGDTHFNSFDLIARYRW
uniref:autotransporter outer membrane beta-barrel domain-containing protein n=2 Tax=Acidithiobacillus thiooxidans TaxID=930 RepID=UPI00055906D4